MNTLSPTSPRHRIGSPRLCASFASFVVGRRAAAKRSIVAIGLQVGMTWGIWASAAHAAPPSVAETAKRVDQAIEAAWKSAAPQSPAASPAPPCDDATYVRRVWLDIVGDLPTPEHVIAFSLDPAADKRARLVEELTADARYGLNWARYWRDVLLARRLEDRALAGANALEADLAGWLNAGEGWDAIAARFLTAKGDVRENGATALIFAQDGRTEETAAEAARIFLAMQIQCAQCHDHPYDSWKRRQFHELAAFFPRVGVRRVRTTTRRSFAVIGVDRQLRRRRPVENRPELEHRMPDLEDPNKEGELIAPRFFLTGASLPVGALDDERRTTLAAWFAENPWFSKAVVNRLWSELVGEGFYEPVDDMGPERQGKAIAALEVLASQLEANDYDLKWLLRAICATEAYQRESRPRRSPEAPPFLANVPQPLRADQLLNALLSAFDQNEPDARGIANRPREQSLRAQMNAEFGFDPSDLRDSVAVSIPQTLAMMNSQRLDPALQAVGRTSLASLCDEIDDLSDLVDELYLRMLCRLPTPSERATLTEYFSRTSERREAVEDLAWALMNSAEFRHRR